MKTLVLRIYLTLVAVLLLFALLSSWLIQNRLEAQRQEMQASMAERAAGWAQLVALGLPSPDAEDSQQQEAIQQLSDRLQMPLALESGDGRRVAAAAGFVARELMPSGRDRPSWRLSLPDGRVLLVLRGPGMRPGPPRGEGPPWMWVGSGGGFLLLLALLFIAVAAAAWPVARRLTRRLETLQSGVRAFGEGDLSRRVPIQGHDEVAALAQAFNHSAERVESLVAANRNLLAHASHELRSPLARLKMALTLRRGATPARMAQLDHEAERNMDELDALVDELLMASRLQAGHAAASAPHEPLDLLALTRDEIARERDIEPAWVLEFEADSGADHRIDQAMVRGDAALLRRAIRNLLVNAHRYGGGWALVRVQAASLPERTWQWSIEDRGQGVPADCRERIFEPFFRLPGHAEAQGGTGLGLALVRQIAQAHGGSVGCEAGREVGSRFVLSVPAA